MYELIAEPLNFLMTLAAKQCLMWIDHVWLKPDQLNNVNMGTNPVGQIGASPLKTNPIQY